MAHDLGIDLIELSAADLAALRLAAQVMAHRAVRAGRPAVALYFDSLKSAALAEDAARAQAGAAGRSIGENRVNPIETAIDADDRLLIDQYLDLLAGNDGLPEGVRGVFGGLRHKATG